jgi:hypothetical protein
MHETIRAHFQELEDAVRTTTIPAGRQEVIAGSVLRLSTLYDKFRQTCESRYFDEITHLVQGVLKDLEACPEAQRLDANFREKLWLLHEELGLPRLPLKAAPLPPRPKKPRKK